MGATARVYLARDVKHSRRVALKILRPELAGSVAHERFLREISVAAGLQHPNILPLYDSGHTANSVFFVMPFMEGESLRDRMTRERRMSLADCVGIVREIADGLTFAHERGVVHRDVKPENVILGGGHAFIADFGIAQALRVATIGGTGPGEERLTGGGFVVGTLPYMSPEQLSGSDVDGRADQYSLAVVFFEMMTAQLPHSGTTPTHMIAQRLKKPKRIRLLRKDVSRRVDAVLARAMAADPAQRFGTARDFADELSRVAITSSSEAKRQRIVSWMAGAATVAAAVGVVNFTRTADAVPLDPTLYAVLRFAHDGSAEKFLGGDNCQLLLTTAFNHWRGLRLVDHMRANSAYAEVVGDNVPTLERVLDAARTLRAGNAVWGAVRTVGDSLYVRATLYDVASGESIREGQVAIPSGLDSLPAKFRQLADTLLLHVPGAPSTADATGTLSLDAWRAYSEGHRALARWDLTAAQAAFTHATELDPDYAHAWLWLVQSMNWSRLFARSEWRDAAARLVTLDEKLPLEDREAARALLELAEGQFQDACQRYRALILADSSNFRAWFGLGECQSLDRVVVADRASPSGWRFRSSQHSAIEAYRRALQLTPTTFMAFRGRAFDRLEALLFANPAQYKRGLVIRGNDTTMMGAFPSLVGDTIAFVPFTTAQLFDFSEARPTTLEAAVARNRNVLLAITRSWARAFPRSPDALEAYGRALELMGALAMPPDDNARARYVRARAVSSDAAQQTRLAVAEVRVLLKTRDFTNAGRLADSIALAAPSPSSDDPSMRAPLAALTGRMRIAADLAAQGAANYVIYLRSGRVLRPPLAVGAAASRAETYAAFGVSADTIRALLLQVQREIDRWLPPADRAEARRAVLEPVAAVAFEQLGPGVYHEAPTLWLSSLQQRALRGQRASVVASLDSLATDDLSNAESVYHGARVALGMGDSVRAAAILDNFIAGLPADGDHMFSDAIGTAPIVRILAQRAELARTSNPGLARQLAAGVVALWRQPDGELAATLRKMKALQ